MLGRKRMRSARIAMTKRPDRSRNLPLLDWGDQLRQTKRERRTLVRRVAVIGAGITLVGLTIAFPPAPRLAWNASASAPIGPDAVTPGQNVEPDDMVIESVPDRPRMLAAARRYLPAAVTTVKRMEAAAGSEVTWTGPVTSG